MKQAFINLTENFFQNLNGLQEKAIMNRELAMRAIHAMEIFILNEDVNEAGIVDWTEVIPRLMQDQEMFQEELINRHNDVHFLINWKTYRSKMLDADIARYGVPRGFESYPKWIVYKDTKGKIIDWAKHNERAKTAFEIVKTFDIKKYVEISNCETEMKSGSSCKCGYHEE